MCVTCGCSDGEKITAEDPLTGELILISHDEAHARGHAHEHHSHSHAAGAAVVQAHETTIEVERKILGKNQLLAEQNRAWLKERGILALNLVSSPGSGKTTLLEKTLLDLQDEFEICVVEGDQETANDAERIRATGCRAVQINTGSGCHLEAEMIAKAIETLNPAPSSLLFIENVGNLVCPALFDLGERAKVAILSVTEGEDKPLKYPHMFRASRFMLLNKSDLLPYLNFDTEKCISYAKEVNPAIEVITVSAATGEGMDEWYERLRQMRRQN